MYKLQEREASFARSGNQLSLPLLFATGSTRGSSLPQLSMPVSLALPDGRATEQHEAQVSSPRVSKGCVAAE